MSPIEGWAELARSDFTLTHANINGGLLSDPTLGASLGEPRGWEDGGRPGMDDGWAISLFFPPLSSAPLPFFFQGCIMCVYVAACTRSVVFSCSIAVITADSCATARRLKTSNAASSRSYFIDLLREEKKKKDGGSLGAPLGSV